MPRERSDLRVKGVVLAGALLAAALAVLLIGLHAFTVSEAPRPLDEAALPALSPIGESEFESGDQLAAFRSEELKRLNTYDWVESGIARIPIERAMELEK